jgi:hypothetical protein
MEKHVIVQVTNYVTNYVDMACQHDYIMIDYYDVACL